ncbi:MAG: cytochrome c oxidase subunit 3 [Acidobacteriaceae bacterium]|nr:cytochrome c oxidase subunit 3 [Acidobacteriaceae bacterium]
MPTLTPPPVYTPDKKKRKDRAPQGPGSGGKPPYLKRTGGGGDGDDGGDDHRRNGHGPGERLRRARPAMLFFLLADSVGFLILIVLFLVGRTGQVAHIGPTGVIMDRWHAIPIPPILWLNTAILLLSSVTMELARRHIFNEEDVMDEWLGLGKPAARRAMPWLLATCLLGVLFLVGQWMAWAQLATRRGYLAVYQNATVSRSYFNLFTGFHAVHLVFALMGLSVCVGTLLYARRLETRQVWLDTASWCWHAMGIFWIALFSVLVWGQ